MGVQGKKKKKKRKTGIANRPFSHLLLKTVIVVRRGGKNTGVVTYNVPKWFPTRWEGNSDPVGPLNC